MNIEDIKRRVKDIDDESKCDIEAAHGMEDDLYLDFVEFLSKSAPHPFDAMAEEVLKTRQIEFTRYCA